MAGKKDKLIAEGDKLFGKGKIEGAIKSWEEALAETPKDVNLLNKIGDAWAKINRSDKAVDYYLRVGDHFAADGFFLKAIAMFKKINKLDPSRLDIYDRLADLYAKQGLALEAKGQYQVLADYHVKQGNVEDAIGVYLKIAGLDPNNINNHVKLADLFVQAKKLDEALQRFDQVGKMLLQKGMLDEAAQVYQKALKLQPGSPRALEALVGILQQKNDPAAALGILEQAAGAAPGNARLLLLLGKAYSQLGRNNDAEKALAQASAAAPDDPEILEARTGVALRKGDVDGAFAALRPLADAAADRGEPHRAIAVLAPILKVDPHHVGTLEAYVGYYQRAGEETTVLNHRNLLAEAFIAREEFPRAAAALTELIRIEPENAQHRTKLDFVRRRMGIVPEAPPPPASPVALPPILAPDFDETGSFLSKMDGGVVEESAVEFPSLSETSGEFMPPPGDLPEVEIDLSGGDGDAESVPLAGDRDFVAEHLTEAEVFSKYGLIGKAIEHFELVLSREPAHAVALSRILDLYVEEGQKAKASETAVRLMRVVRAEGDREAVLDLEERLERAGVQLPSEAPAPRVSRAIPTPPPSAPTFEPEPVDDEVSVEIDLDAAAVELPSGDDAVLDLEAALGDQALGMGAEAPEALSEPAGFTFDEPVVEALEEAVEDLVLPEAVVADEEPETLLDLEEDEPAEEPGDRTVVSTQRPTPAFQPSPKRSVEPPPDEEGALFEDTAPVDLPVEEEVLEISMEEPTAAPEPPPPAVVVPPPPPVAAKAEAPAAPVLPRPAAARPHAPKTTDLDELLGKKKPAKAAKAHAPSPDTITDAFLRDLGMGAGKKKKDEVPHPHEAAVPAAAAEKAPAPAPPPAEDIFFAGESAVESLPVEELGEIDFYIDQGLSEEARRILDRLEKKHPGHPELAARRSRIDRPAAPPRRATGPIAVPTITAEEQGDVAMDLDLGRAIEEEMAKLESTAGPAPATAAAAQGANEENLFADEESFFDLASELEQELVEEKPAAAASVDSPLQTEEASLEDIFREFKKGVEQQLDAEDYDTHYNLGIAYKEMGLVDEAIGEFQIASKDPKRAIECCSMLGLCFLEKGMSQLAIKWYRKGLENPDIREEENLGLLYDLANVYQESGDLAAAHKTLVELYGISANYRDVTFRIKELEDAIKG